MVWTKCICSSVTIVFDVKSMNTLLLFTEWICIISTWLLVPTVFRKASESRIAVSCPSGDAEFTVNPSFHGTGFLILASLLRCCLRDSCVSGSSECCESAASVSGLPAAAGASLPHQVYPSFVMPCPSIRMGTETIRRDGPGGALPATVAGHQSRARLLLQLFRTRAASAP